MPRVEATPNHTVLKWARENAGYTSAEIAKKLKSAEARILSWESGDARPTVTQLRRLAATYRRPLAFFYLPVPPHTFEAMHDFRRLPGVEMSESPELRLEIRHAWERRDIALELFDDLGEAPIEIAIGAIALGDDADDVGREVRSWLGVTPQRQSAWGETPYTALREWRAALEGRGVLALQATGIDVDEMRGFSIAERPLPVTVANIKDAPRGRVFTFLHELVHVLLQENSLCDWREPTGTERRVENFCNRVAAAILIPANELRSSDPVRRHERGSQWTAGELTALGRRFAGASEEAILLRLLGMGLTTQAAYDQRREDLRTQYAAQRARPQEGFAPPHRISLAALGPTFTRLVLEGFDREKISASDVADFLGMRLKHLGDVRHEMRRAS
jgi:Zn-dependent peptidase ImmA (M78 family)